MAAASSLLSLHAEVSLCQALLLALLVQAMARIRDAEPLSSQPQTLVPFLAWCYATVDSPLWLVKLTLQLGFQQWELAPELRDLGVSSPMDQLRGSRLVWWGYTRWLFMEITPVLCMLPFVFLLTFYPDPFHMNSWSPSGCCFCLPSWLSSVYSLITPLLISQCVWVFCFVLKVFPGRGGGHALCSWIYCVYPSFSGSVSDLN